MQIFQSITAERTISGALKVELLPVVCSFDSFIYILVLFHRTEAQTTDIWEVPFNVCVFWCVRELTSGIHTKDQGSLETSMLRSVYICSLRTNKVLDVVAALVLIRSVPQDKVSL